MISEELLKMAPCLRSGPYAESGRLLVTSTQRLGTSRWATIVRAWVVSHLFHEQERIFKTGEDPVPQFSATLTKTAHLVDSMAASGMKDLTSFSEKYAHTDDTVDADVGQSTGKHYGNLFREFSKESFLEATELLRARFERNGITSKDLHGKRALDAGCGGGRYTVALKNLGAKEVVGADLSTIGIANAAQRVEALGIEGVTFVEANVLDMPFDDNEFDIVFSNGVLHHTVDWDKGIGETVRVMKPDGMGFLYLIEDPGGIFWDMVEILRVVMKHESKNAAQLALRAAGMPANRIFYMLDHVMVPINVRLTPQQVEESLKKHGAKDIRRLTRGTDFDRIESFHKHDPFAKQKWGVGENRYIFSK